MRKTIIELKQSKDAREELNTLLKDLCDQMEVITLNRQMISGAIEGFKQKHGIPKSDIRLLLKHYYNQTIEDSKNSQRNLEKAYQLLFKKQDDVIK